MTTNPNLAAGLAVASALLFSACGGKQKNDNGSQRSGMPMAVQVHVLATTPLENTVTSSGTLLANEKVDIQSEVSGRITSISFKEGAAVKTGQVLVQINADDLNAQLRKAEAELELARTAEKRQSQLLEAKGISQEAYDAAHAQLLARKADVDNLKALIAKTTIRAPFNGVIGLRHVSEGGYVAPNTLIATLTQTDPIKLDFNMPERYGRMVKDGLEVQFRLEGDTTPYRATIYAIEPSVQAETRTVQVRARTSNPNGRLVPGSFARVRTDLGTVEHALTIPAEGLIPDIKGQVVMLMKSGKATTARVEVGLRTEDEVQLISGVQPGDTVIVSGLLAVREGMPVRPATKKQSTAGTNGAMAGAGNN